VGTLPLPAKYCREQEFVLNLCLNLRVNTLCMRAATIQVVTSVTVWVCTLTFQAVPQSDAQSPEITFRTSSNLVLVDVVALNSKNELADTTRAATTFSCWTTGARLRSRHLITRLEPGRWHSGSSCSAIWRVGVAGLGLVCRTNPSLRTSSRDPELKRQRGCGALV
jgi:hypothetical protein